MVVVQFFAAGHEVGTAGRVDLELADGRSQAVVEGLGFKFAIVGLLNAVWVWLFHHNHHVLGFIVVILLTLAISGVYWELKTTHPPKNKISAIFVHLPFCESSVIYFEAAFTAAYALRNSFVARLERLQPHSDRCYPLRPRQGTPACWPQQQDCCLHCHRLPGFDERVRAAGQYKHSSADALGSGYAFHSSQGDIAGAAVIAFELLAIFVGKSVNCSSRHSSHFPLPAQQHPKIIHWFALGGFVVSLLAIVKAVFYTARNPSLVGDDGERAPLIAGSD